jgi:phosphohistidine phosphatase
VAQQLWFLRHGDAVPHGTKPDPERELTSKGERQSQDAGAALARIGVSFDACYTSPKVRARDTARLACEPLGIEPEEVESLSGGLEREDALELLMGHDADANLLLVGHEPDFSQVVHDLTGARIQMKKGGVVAVKVERGGGELVTLLRPRELRKLA